MEEIITNEAIPETESGNFLSDLINKIKDFFKMIVDWLKKLFNK